MTINVNTPGFVPTSQYNTACHRTQKSTQPSEVPLLFGFFQQNTYLSKSRDSIKSSPSFLSAWKISEVTSLAHHEPIFHNYSDTFRIFETFWLKAPNWKHLCDDIFLEAPR